MKAFIIVVLAPALGFMMYALSQFLREAIQLRRGQGNEGRKAVTVVTAFAPLDKENGNRRGNEPDGQAALRRKVFFEKNVSTSQKYVYGVGHETCQKREENVIVLPLGTVTVKAKQVVQRRA